MDYPARLRCKDGSAKNVEIHASVYEEHGKILHARCFTRAVTDHKRSDALRNIANIKTAGSLSILEQEQQRQKIEHLRSICTNVSHDLKTPLHCIEMAVDSLDTKNKELNLQLTLKTASALIRAAINRLEPSISILEVQ